MQRLLLLLFLFPLAGFSQNQEDTLLNKMLSVADLQSDFKDYRTLLETTHPGLYRYTSKTDMQAKMNDLAVGFQEPMPFYDFYKKIAQLNAAIRCAHSSVMPTAEIESYTYQNIKTLPLYLYPIQGKIYVIFNGTMGDQIQPGFELIEINQIPVDSIAWIIKQHYWADGYIELSKKKALDGAFFGLFYYALIERPDTFQLTFKDLKGALLKVEVPAQSLALSNQNFVKNPVNKQMMAFYNKNPKKPWRLSFPEEVAHTALLRFDAFGGKRMEDNESAAAAMQQFMNKALKKIKKRNIQNLIIDLRGNAGGWDVQGAELLSYLVQSDTSFSYYRRLHTITDDSPYLKYSDLSPQDLMNVQKELEPRPDGTFSLLPMANSGLRRQKAKPNRFKGNVYILMDAYSASTTAEFLALAKENQVGVLVGEESGGAAAGGNGGSFISYTLPKSGILVRTPLIFYQNVISAPIVKGRGVMPHHLVQMQVEDLLINKNRQLDFVLDLIKKNKKP